MTEQQRLEKRIKDLQRLHDQDRERKKQKPIERMDDDKPDTLSKYDFWCDNCQEDFQAPCYKTRHRICGERIAVYRAKCSNCETDTIRHITHRDEDKYYQKSDKIRRNRNQYAWETLQAQDTGFRTCYGNPYAEFDKEMIEKEQMIFKEEREKGFKGLSLKAKEKRYGLLSL